ncbi:MAG: ligand-binding sensor domain-containing protein [Bacteroidota bacterium]
MKKLFSQIHVLPFLIILLFGTVCSGPAKKDLPQEKEHPKFIKNIGNGNVQCGLQDKAGNLWFGTSDNGLFKYDGKSFTQYLATDGLNINNIFTLVEDNDGKIWIGTGAGLYLYDGRTFSKIRIPLRKNLQPNKNTNNRNSDWVFSIVQAKSGKLWFATIHGVYIYDGKSFTPFIVSDNTGGYMSSNNNVEYILEDTAGNIWFGGRGNEGVYRYDGNSITNFKLKELTLQFESRRVGHNWAWPQLQDKNGNIWFSNWGGAYRYDGKTFTSFTKSDGLPGYNGLVAKIIEDKNGNLWFGGDGGLSRYDGKSFTCFHDGLINPWIWTILEDKTGAIWVGTRETGLYRFDGKRFTNFSE